MREMRTVKMVPFNLRHLEKLCLRPEAEDLKDITRELENIYCDGPAYTAIIEDQVVFCAGITITWHGVGVAWCYADCSASKYAREVYCAQLGFLDRCTKEYGLHRVQAFALASWRMAWRYLERLGFQREGLMRKYSPNQEDYYLYARVA